jgi:hypothetical protein
LPVTRDVTLRASESANTPHRPTPPAPIRRGEGERSEGAPGRASVRGVRVTDEMVVTMARAYVMARDETTGLHAGRRPGKAGGFEPSLQARCQKRDLGAADR